jgi:hypothetical protein
MKDLIERLDKAKEGSRELDAKIHAKAALKAREASNG